MKKTLALLYFIATLVSQAAAEKLNILTYDYPPFAGQGGILDNIIQQSCDSIALDCYFTNFPVARSIFLFGDKSHPAIIGVMEMLPPEKQAVSDIIPLIQTYTSLFYLKSERSDKWGALTYQKISQLKLKIGVMHAFDDEVLFLENNLGIKVEKYNTLPQLIKMLAAGRIDLFSGTRLATYHHINNTDKALFNKIRELPPYNTIAAGIIYTKSNSNYADSIRHFVENNSSYRDTIEKAFAEFGDFNSERYLIKQGKQVAPP